MRGIKIWIMRKYDGKMKKIALFPGSFDPITLGHLDIVNRALPLFDEIIVAVGMNSQKKYLFSLEHRLDMLEAVFKSEPKIRIDHFKGLTVNYCKSQNVHYLLRGIRSSGDFDYEKTISQLNHVIGDELETVFLITKPEFSFISSTIVREIIKGDGDVSSFVPDEIESLLAL